MTLGVYLLGALDPVERSTFESHLSYCDICRGELVRLAPLPGLLNQITPEDFADSLPPTWEEGPAGTTVTTHAEPITDAVPIPVQRPLPPTPAEVGLPAPARPVRTRSYRRVLAAAAVVVVLAVGAVFGWRAMREEPVLPVADGVTWAINSPDGRASVEARLVDHEWGTEIQSKIHGLPPGRKCYLFVYDHYGNREVAGWWGTDHDPNEEIPASTSIMRSKIDRLEYMLDDKETIVFTIEAPR